MSDWLENINKKPETLREKISDAYWRFYRWVLRRPDIDGLPITLDPKEGHTILRLYLIDEENIETLKTVYGEERKGLNDNKDE